MTKNISFKKKLLIVGTFITVLAVSFFTYIRLKNDSKPVQYSDVTIVLERTACYGTCAVYKLIVSGDGKVTYTGERFVKMVGSRTAQLTPQELASLVDQFYAIDYFSLQDKYEASITDLPTTITSISIDGRMKRIEDYYGAPKQLKELENKIDQITNSSQWTGK